MQGQRAERQIYLRAKHPNPLFEGWLEQWLLEAQRKDSRKRFSLTKALESLRRYPLVLHSARDCSILEGFGKGICTALEKQLKIYQTENPAQILPSERDVELLEQTVICDVRSILEEKERELEEEKPPHNISHGREAEPEKPDDPMHELFLKYGHLVEPEKYKSIEKKASSLSLSPPSKRTRFEFESPKIRLRKNSFKIVLLVDTAETAG